MAVREQTESQRIAAERERHVARGVATTPLVVARAEGARIWDADGREYVDFAGGLGCQNTGHGFAAAAIHEQVDRYLHQCFMVGTYEPFVHGYAVQKSIVARPVQCEDTDVFGKSGWSWDMNSCARDDGVPVPKPAPILPPV